MALRIPAGWKAGLLTGSLLLLSAAAARAQGAPEGGGGDGGGAIAALIAAMSGVFSLVYIVVLVLTIVGMWKMFEKAGKPGWAAIIPIYNLIVLLEIAGRPIWWIILCCIPFVNFVVLIILTYDLAQRFGQGVGFMLGLLFLPFIFYPLLGFGNAQYNPPLAYST